MSGSLPHEVSSVEDVKKDNIPFESISITDIDGHASSNVLRVAAVHHFNNVEKGYFDFCTKSGMSCHFLKLVDRWFQTHLSFMFMIFNVLQRRQVLLSASTKVKQNSFYKIAEDFIGISVSDIKAVTEWVACSDYTTTYTSNEKRVLRLMKEVNLSIERLKVLMLHNWL